jgi:beta-ribofuranosylaminobenzene 5'-phosphate synthase
MLESIVESVDGVENSAGEVTVITTARLHMGFFDLNGGLGRRFGSIGVSLDQPATKIHVYRADKMSADGAGAERAIKIANKLAKAVGVQGGMHMQLAEIIPEHSGLGSGTQMSLAVGVAMSKLYDMGLGIADIAKLTERGARSGIGVGTFATGGVIVDGGRAHGSMLVPPVIARADFPEEWRIVLIFDHAHTGVHGEEENEAFRTLPVFSADDAAILCRHVLMQALPALAEHDLANFGLAIRALQERIGDYFAPVQGGRYASPRVAQVLAYLEGLGVVCLGQSSWGPTGFAVFADKNEAESVMQQLKVRFAHEKTLDFVLCQGRNQAAVVN